MTRIERPDETINVDLSVYFFYFIQQKRWLTIEDLTSKNDGETQYDAIEKKIETMPNPYKKISSWFELLEKACNESEGERLLCRLVPMNI